MPKFSFITIALNESLCLPRLLNDLRQQDYPHGDIEVLLVDSSSTDGTRRIMTDFERDNDFFRCVVLDNPKKVLAAGWNVALAHATGDYVIKIDGHGRIDSDFLSSLARLADGSEDIIGGQRITVFDGESTFSKVLAHAECSPFGSGVASYRKKCERKYVKTLAHAAYSKKVFDTVGGFNEALRRTEDNEIHCRMRKAGFRFCQCPEICSYLHARSTLASMLRQKRGNGLWIGITFPKCPGGFSLYNFVPMIFVLSLIISAAVGAATGDFILTWVIAAAYLLAAVCATAAQMIHENSVKVKCSMAILPVIFLLMHIWYGLFTVAGLIASPFVKADRKKKHEV